MAAQDRVKATAHKLTSTYLPLRERQALAEQHQQALRDLRALQQH